MSEIYKSHYTGEEIDEKLASIETLSTEISNMYNRLNTKLINLDDKVDKINTILSIQSESSSEEGSEEEPEGNSSSPKNIIEELQDSIVQLKDVLNEPPEHFEYNNYENQPILTTVDNIAEIDTFYCVRYKDIIMLKVRWTLVNDNGTQIKVLNYGNVTDRQIFQLHPKFCPYQVSTTGFSDGNNQARQSGIAFYSIYPSGKINLTACDGTGTERYLIPGEDAFWLSAIYISKWSTYTATPSVSSDQLDDDSN